MVMQAEWSIECGAGDPVLVVPWAADDATVKYIDLRTDPDAIEEISEADNHPALLHALRAINAQRSPVFTAKCDAWPLDATELAALLFDLGDSVHDPVAGYAGYIDLVWRDRAIFLSRHHHQQLMNRIERLAAPLDRPAAKLEGTLRHCFLDFDAPQEGFCLTLYVKAVGTSPDEAYANWAAALEDVAALIRRREMATL